MLPCPTLNALQFPAACLSKLLLLLMRIWLSQADIMPMPSFQATLKSPMFPLKSSLRQAPLPGLTNVYSERCKHVVLLQTASIVETSLCYAELSKCQMGSRSPLPQWSRKAIVLIFPIRQRAMIIRSKSPMHQNELFSCPGAAWHVVRQPTHTQSAECTGK